MHLPTQGPACVLAPMCSHFNPTQCLSLFHSVLLCVLLTKFCQEMWHLQCSMAYVSFSKIYSWIILTCLESFAIENVKFWGSIHLLYNPKWMFSGWIHWKQHWTTIVSLLFTTCQEPQRMLFTKLNYVFSFSKIISKWNNDRHLVIDFWCHSHNFPAQD